MRCWLYRLLYFALYVRVESSYLRMFKILKNVKKIKAFNKLGETPSAKRTTNKIDVVTNDPVTKADHSCILNKTRKRKRLKATRYVRAGTLQL